MKLLPFDYAGRNLLRSPIRLAAMVLSCALVVALIMVAASFGRGMGRTLVASTDHSNVILLAAGSEESLERSQIEANATGVVTADIQGLKTRLGVPYVSPEIHVALLVRTRPDSTEELRGVFRGVTPEAFLVHPRVQIVEGRMPRAGNDEILVGGLAAEKMGLDAAALKPAATLWFDNRQWKVVGRFLAPGTVMDAEIWMPLTDLQMVTKRESVSCVVVTLGEAEFGDVDAFAKQRFDLGLVAIRESDYYASLMKFYRPVRAMVWTTAFLIAMAGLFGGLNSIYAAFASRVRELGTLQSLGYSRIAITVSLVQESVLAASTGALLASVLCLVFLNGFAVRFSMGVFQLSVDQTVLAIGLVTGLILGLVGGIPPAWKCLRVPIAQAFKAA